MNKLQQQAVMAFLAQQGFTAKQIEARVTMKREPAENEILVYGEIVDEGWRAMLAEWGDESFISAESFGAKLDALTGQVLMRMNSVGGDVWEVAAMYQKALEWKAVDGNSLACIVDGKACSAASYLMLAADDIEISEMGSVMIHYPRGGSRGRAKELKSYADFMFDQERKCEQIYGNRMNVAAARVKEMLDNETWLNSDKAVECGLVDRISDPGSDDPENEARAARDRHAQETAAMMLLVA